jgi:small subunit ribosomal protein S17
MRSKKGTVTSDKMEKTIVIDVVTYESHPKYKKRYRKNKKYMVNDPENKYKIGDSVTIFEENPTSKKKRWTVVEPEVKE